MTTTARHRRTPDWLVALAMMVGGSLPVAALMGVGSVERWPDVAVVGGSVVLFFLGAFGGGVLATERERDA